jgi:ElaB/YqjD/DUF883 family membrane-anchored ribosome-binding protein
MKNGTAQLEKQLDNLRDDFTNLVTAASKLIAGKAVDAKDVVADRGSDAMSAMIKAIKGRPLVAIGVAFGIGYIAMRLTRR